MEIEKSIDAIRDEVLRKIGRNVVLFQQLECLMKAVVANKNIAAPASTITQVRATKHAEFENHTMGQLVGKLQKDLYVTTDDDADSATPDEISEPWISFSFRIQSDAAFVDSRSKALSELVASRNDLVHKLLPRWQMESADSCKDLENHLDAQAISVRAEIAHLEAVRRSMKESSKQIAEFLGSPDGQKQFELAWLQQSRLVLMLGDIAGQEARPDGWTYLSTAGSILKRKSPEEYDSLESRYGYKKLLDLVIAAKLFDVAKEQRSDGSVRYLYRVDPDWALHCGAIE